MPGQQHSWERAPAAQPGLQAAEHSPGARLSKSQPLPSEADAGNCGGGWAARSSLLLQLLSAGGAARNGLGALQSAAPASLTEAGMWREREAHTKKKKKKKEVYTFINAKINICLKTDSPRPQTRAHTLQTARGTALGARGEIKDTPQGSQLNCFSFPPPLRRPWLAGGRRKNK